MTTSAWWDALPDRVTAKIERLPDGCWLWTGAIGSGHGYGMAWDGRRMIGAHRLVFELVVGPIAKGLQLDHLCRVRRCVNPAHLEPVAQRTNILRGASPAATRAAASHCHRGHPFDQANTYRRRDTGHRRCRACDRERRAAA